MAPRTTIVLLALTSTACVRQSPVARSPQPPPTVWERQVRNARDAGDGDYPLRLLRDKVAADSASIPARLELAKAYRERGYPDVGIEILRLAASRFPESGEIQLALVRTLHDQHHATEALAGLDAFLQQHPQTEYDYFSWMGILRDESGQWAAGESAHRKALEIRPADDSLHNNLGYNLLMQAKVDDAAAEFREALKLNPQSAIARNNLGLALAARSDTTGAVANWQSAADASIAHNNLAATWIEKGNYPAARQELQVALGYNKDLPAALKNLELVSRLDGNPASLRAAHESTGWERWKTGIKKLFVGPLDEPRKEPAKAATKTAPGEE
jgi:Flp pilus assembly protein TadD